MNALGVVQVDNGTPILPRLASFFTAGPKVSNLINMMALARYDYLLISDSDVRVTCSYLSKVVAPLLDPRVGIVTCSYSGWPRAGLWSLLGCLFINEWFTPSVRVAARVGPR